MPSRRWKEISHSVTAWRHPHNVNWVVLRTSYFNVLRMSVEQVLRMSVGDVPWCYIEDHMGTSIGRFLETSSIRPQDVSLPSGHSTKKAYININSLLSKKDKIRFIANKDEAAITGITESNKTLPYCTRFRSKPSRI